MCSSVECLTEAQYLLTGPVSLQRESAMILQFSVFLSFFLNCVQVLTNSLLTQQKNEFEDSYLQKNSERSSQIHQKKELSNVVKNCIVLMIQLKRF